MTQTAHSSTRAQPQRAVAAAKDTKSRGKRAPRRAKLTDAAVRAAKQGITWDTEYRGFGLRVGSGDTPTRTFIVFRRIKGTLQPKQITIGRYPIKTVEAARADARRLLSDFMDGVDPEAKEHERKAGGFTFGDAWALYQQKLKAKKRAEKTTKRYSQYVRTYLGPWMKRALADFERGWVREQHLQLAEDVRKGKYAQEIKHPRKYKKRKGAKVSPYNRNGETTANDVFRFARAVYLWARVEHDALPANPFKSVNWFSLEPRRAAIPRDRLQDWYAGVQRIARPERRDFLLVALFTGLRKDTIATLRWEDVDFAKRVVFIPKPKGGKKKAFHLPLSDYLVELLEARKAGNEDLARKRLLPANSPWVFPAYSKSGHVIDPRENVGVPYIIHGLRNTFLTEADAADVSSYVMEVLANHRPPKSSMTAQYLTIDEERLREPMQRITNRLRALCTGALPPGNVLQMPVRQAA